MFFGVQYRDMHTAVHHIAIFKKPSDAKRLLLQIETNETMGPPYMQSEDDIEINFRNVPTEHKGQPLVLVNVERAVIPDCY